MREHRRSVRLKMLAEADWRILGKPDEDALQQILAIEQCRFGKVEAVAVEQIEQEVAQPVLAAGFQIRLQIVQAGNAGRVFDDDFPVDEPRPSFPRASAMLRKRFVQSSAFRVNSRMIGPSMRACIR
jgi:hypothetical protein